MGLLVRFHKKFLGELAISLDSFEFLHETFLEDSVSFSLIPAMTITSVVQQVESLELVSWAFLMLIALAK